MQGGKQSVRATAACLSSLALPIQAWKQPDLNFRSTAESRSISSSPMSAHDFSTDYKIVRSDNILFRGFASDVKLSGDAEYQFA